MGRVKFRIDSQPVAQGRPRLTTIHGRPRAFDPKKSRDYKAFIKDCAAAAMSKQGVTEPLKGPIIGRMRFGFKLPKSDRRKRSPIPRKWHIKRPDLDNLVKSILDACKDTVYHDDTDISKLVIDKIVCAQDETPFIMVSFETMDEFSTS